MLLPPRSDFKVRVVPTRERKQEQHRSANKYRSYRCSINARQALDRHRNRIRCKRERNEIHSTEKITTGIGKRVELVAYRRRGNVNAHHPRIIAIKALEIRQTNSVEISNNPNSGGMIEPNVTMNPS
jgi:hypothetical protein